MNELRKLFAMVALDNEYSMIVSTSQSCEGSSREHVVHSGAMYSVNVTLGVLLSRL